MSDPRLPKGWVTPTKPRIHRAYTSDRGWFWRVVTPPIPPQIHSAHYRDTYADALEVVRRFHAGEDLYS